MSLSLLSKRMSIPSARLSALTAYWSASVLRSVNDPIYTAWFAQSIDSKVRATVLSMSGQADALGQIAGGPAIGVIGNVVSIRAAIVAAGAVLSPVLVLFVRTMRGEGCRSGDQGRH